jgi:20S proteasome subunit beta 5
MADLSFMDSPDFALPSFFTPKPDAASFLLPAFSTPEPSPLVAKGSEEARKLHQFAKGTTTLGFVFQGGILIAVDARATMGSFIGSNQVKKVIEINEYLLGTMAGGAADCFYWETNLARVCRLYELKHGERISVGGAAKILSDMVGQYKGYGLSMGTMIAGWDHKGPSLYMVDDDGIRMKGNIFSVGSGSVYAYGVLDSHYRFDLTIEQAVELGRRAIYHAGHRDAMSGGVVRVYHIHQNGWTRVIPGEDINKIHDIHEAEKGMTNMDDEVTFRF